MTGERRTVRLDGLDRDSLVAIVGATGDGPVIPGLIFGDNYEEACDLVSPQPTGTPMEGRCWSPGRATPPCAGPS